MAQGLIFVALFICMIAYAAGKGEVMEEIDKVYAEELHVGDLVWDNDEDVHVEIVGILDNGDWISVETELDGELIFTYGQLVPIYGYMSVEV